MKIERGSQSESGSIRLILFLLVCIGFLLWKGGQELYTAMSNRKPTVMSYDAYVKEKPTGTWLMLTNCTLDFTDAAYRSVKGGSKPIELFVPVHGEAISEGSVQVVLSTKRQEFLDVTIEIEGLKSETEAAAWILKNRDRAFRKGDIEGLVRFGLEMKDSERRKLAGLQQNLATDFIILNDGGKPSLASGLGFFGGGIAVLFGGIWYMRSNRDESATDV